MSLHLKDNIKIIRKLMGLTQVEFIGKFHQVSEAMQKSYESGKASPDIIYMQKLSEIAGISIADLTEKEINASELEHLRQKKVEKVETEPIIKAINGAGNLIYVDAKDLTASYERIIEAKEQTIAEKEARRLEAKEWAERAEAEKKDLQTEKKELLSMLTKYLNELLSNSQELKESFANANTEMQVEHYAIMGALDQIQGNQPGTLAVKAGKAEHDLKEAIKESHKKHSLSKSNKSH